jgi:hypothetical protein
MRPIVRRRKVTLTQKGDGTINAGSHRKRIATARNALRFNGLALAVVDSGAMH